ncbi:hypothetical protein AYI68_g8086, partial [Smittium mucronatum]
MLEIFIDGEK